MNNICKYDHTGLFGTGDWRSHKTEIVRHFFPLKFSVGLTGLVVIFSSRDNRLSLNQNSTNPSVNRLETNFCSNDDVNLWDILKT